MRKSCKQVGKWFQGHDESECWHKQKDKQKQRFKPSRRGVSVQSRCARRPKVRRKPSRLVLLLIKDQPPWRRLAMTSIQTCLQVYLLPHPTLSPFQRQLLLTSVASATAPLTLSHNSTCAKAHAKGERILRKGITGDTFNAERADVVSPVTTIEGKRYAIFMRNQTLVVDKETEKLLSVAVLLKAGFEVRFVTDTRWPEDSHDFWRKSMALAYVE
jgi:hypothetical protein